MKFTALKDFNLAEGMATEMTGMDVTFDRVTISAAGGTTFELPGELPGETDATKEFTGVILYHHPLFAYYRERFTGGSYDGMTGIGNPGGVCAQCPLNQFGSGENGGKACKNKRRIYILREGELIPILLTLPTGSMKEFAVYVKRLLAKGRKSSSVVTRFSLQKVQNSGGTAHSQTKFAVARVLTEEEQPYISAMAEQVKAFASRVAYVDTLTTIRLFKEHGGEMYFEEQNIYSLDSKVELLLTIMSSLA